METGWYIVTLVVAALVALCFGLKIGATQMLTALYERAIRRLDPEELQQFRALLVSLLIKEGNE